MDPGDMAAIEDAVLRLGQKKTAPAWDQDKHSHEAIYEKLEGLMGDKIQRIYPVAGTSPLITGHVNPDTYGVWVISLTAGNLADPAWLVGIHCELDNIDIYTIQMGRGAPEVPVADFGFEAQAVNTSLSLTCAPAKIAGSPIMSVRCKTVGGGGSTVTALRLQVREA